MKKIKILKEFPTTHYGFLKVGQVLECKEGFADFVVNRMKAGEYVKSPTKAPKKAKK